MEDQNKRKTAKPKNKIKFSFGSLNIRNKIIFGFFIVSIISGLANYYSNLFIVNEFRHVNNTMHMFHNIFAMQKKLEIESLTLNGFIPIYLAQCSVFCY